MYYEKNSNMQNNRHNGRRTTSKQNQNTDSEFIETDFGIRSISSQNFSKIVALPKQALANCNPGKNMKVHVSLVQGNGEKYLKLTPVCSTNTEEIEEKDVKQ